jgi:hypothetical protein
LRFVVVLARKARCGRIVRGRDAGRAGHDAPICGAVKSTFIAKRFQWRLFAHERVWNARGALLAEYERLHLAATMGAPRHPLRSHIVALFQRGDLVSVAEAVLICGASRQAISKWIKAEGISIETRRLVRIAKMTTNAQRYLDGLAPMRRPSKAEMRRTTEEAVRRFNAANATKPF